MYCVYLLEDSNGLGYIGSTCRLNVRLRQHRCKNNNARSKLLAKPFTHLVLEKFEDKDSMMVAEQFYIKLYKSLYDDKLVNKVIPLRTDQEYYDENKDKLLEYSRERYYENQHKEIERGKIFRQNNKEKTKMYYQCNKDKKKAYRKKYYEEHKQKEKEYMRDYKKKKLSEKDSQAS